MTKYIRCRINGTDYGALGNNAVTGIEMTDSAGTDVGVATISLTSENPFTGLILDKHFVQIDEYDSATSSITWIWFTGFVSRRTTKRVMGTLQKTWVIECQDYNLLLDRVVHKLNSGDGNIGVSLSSGLTAAITSLVGTIKGTATSSLTISVASSISGLTQAATYTITRGQSLRNALTALLAQVRNKIDPSKEPRFYITFDKSTGAPVLTVYNAKDTPTAVATFSETPQGSEKSILDYERVLDGADKVQKRQLVYNGFDVVTGSSTDTTTAACAYADGGFWRGEASFDQSLTSSTDAQIEIDNDVFGTGLNRETVTLTTKARAVHAGEYVNLTLHSEGMSTRLYRVARVRLEFAASGQIEFYELTLGLRAIRFGDDSQDDIPAAPVETDTVAPDNPTNVTRTKSDVAGSLASETWIWDRPRATDLAGFKVEAYIGATLYSTTFPPISAVTNGWTITITKNVSYSIKVYSLDYVPNTSAATVSSTVTSHV